ncbi:hypothetical protein FisN_6Lh313 [Fistulifera solaris]|uniref:Uncharacterized protein n=1 Tax=Fistulifera solaris TaxID=1519565 RepID=A0A1Z5J5N5_FISSO|nr:hypothetical protein FisN_6Lh313 [Fistulifera solaris]|eukprot:GAX09317.1 hypothetical protein FisN_6Lh313 [Fistulifera solaris]
MFNLHHSILFLVTLFLGSSISETDLWTTREELLASHKARSDQLEKLLLDAKQRVADHKSGTRLLTDEELTKMEKKVEVFTKKIEKMRKIPDEQEVERILAREREMKRRSDERRRSREEL